MDIEYIREYCLGKPQVTEHFPFDEDTLVFKVAGKMFVLAPLKKWEKGFASINLKCNPEYALELRENYESIEAGWHMSKKHWNSLYIYKGELKPQLIVELIDHSYDMVIKSLPRKIRDTFV